MAPIICRSCGTEYRTAPGTAAYIYATCGRCLRTLATPPLSGE